VLLLSDRDERIAAWRAKVAEADRRFRLCCEADPDETAEASTLLASLHLETGMRHAIDLADRQERRPRFKYWVRASRRMWRYLRYPPVHRLIFLADQKGGN
jgi:hypothetical protein